MERGEAKRGERREEGAREEGDNAKEVEVRL